MEFTKRFLRCFAELKSSDDAFVIIVRGHLYCESALVRLIEERLPGRESLRVDRLDYQVKVQMADALGCIPFNMNSALVQLGSLRNKYVHRLDYQATEKDQRDLINTIRSTIGMPAEWMFRRGTTFPNGLRKAVWALWIPLELNVAKARKEQIDASAVFGALASEVGKSPTQFEEDVDAEWKAFVKARHLHNPPA